MTTPAALTDAECDAISRAAPMPLLMDEAYDRYLIRAGYTAALARARSCDACDAEFWRDAYNTARARTVPREPTQAMKMSDDEVLNAVEPMYAIWQAQSSTSVQDVLAMAFRAGLRAMYDAAPAQATELEQRLRVHQLVASQRPLNFSEREDIAEAADAIAALRAENGNLAQQYAKLKAERDIMKADVARLTQERDAVAVANCPAMCMDFCNTYQTHIAMRDACARADRLEAALRKIKEKYEPHTVAGSIAAGALAQEDGHD